MHPSVYHQMCCRRRRCLCCKGQYSVWSCSSWCLGCFPFVTGTCDIPWATPYRTKGHKTSDDIHIIEFCVVPGMVQAVLTAVAVRCDDDMIGSSKRKRSKRVNNVLSIRDLCEWRIKYQYPQPAFDKCQCSCVTAQQNLTTASSCQVSGGSCLWASHHDVFVAALTPARTAPVM